MRRSETRNVKREGARLPQAAARDTEIVSVPGVASFANRMNADGAPSTIQPSGVIPETNETIRIGRVRR